MANQKFMITGVVSTEPVRVYDALSIDSEDINRPYAYAPVISPKKDKLSVGDTVEYVDGDYVRNRYYDCYPAIVLSADMINGEDISKSYKLVCAFSKEFGDIRFSLKTNSPFFYTNRGDELMVRRGEKRYEIATNTTADALRAAFLQKQK